MNVDVFMKSKSSVILTAVILTALLFSTIIRRPLNAEFIFMKNGEIIEGTIVSDSANSVMLRTTDKKQIKITRDNIMRILYTKLKMGKVFIQKRDGKAIMAFIVDEDQESYTCRKELYSPEEFNLKRSDVLFMAEKNPSGLQSEGDIGTDRVSLTWLAPYGEVKKYNVYIKKGENSKYELADSSKGKNITIKKLESNTSYYLIVTGVDNEDYESSPSNEIKIKTANLHPEKPDILSADKNTMDGTIIYRWKQASDPDGKVVKYRIYGTAKNKRELVTEEKGDFYNLKNPESFDTLELAAVDNSGDESEAAGLPLMNSRYSVALYPGVNLPMGKFGDMAGTGYGVTAGFTLNNHLLPKIDLGADTGFYAFTGKDSAYKETATSYMASLLLTAGYRFEPNYYFSLTPYAGFGAAFFHSDYINRDKITLNESKETISENGPLTSVGVKGSYRLDESFSLVLRLYSNYLVGTDTGLYAGCDVGCMYRL